MKASSENITHFQKYIKTDFFLRIKNKHGVDCRRKHGLDVGEPLSGWTEYDSSCGFFLRTFLAHGLELTRF